MSRHAGPAVAAPPPAVTSARNTTRFYHQLTNTYTTSPRTERLAQVDLDTPLVVSGCEGDIKPVHIAYPHSAKGMTVITLDPFAIQFAKRIIIE